MQASVRAKIGLLPTGHQYYWEQFPGLKEMGLSMCASLRGMLEERVDVVAPDLVDTVEKSRKAGELFRQEQVDAVLVFPVGSTACMNLVPAVKNLGVPLPIVTAHENSSYD